MRGWLLGILGALTALAATAASAHGGVSVENDVCIMRIGQYRAHFSGYQPEFRATQEFCEDIPEVADAIIVLDFIDNALRGMNVEFSVVADNADLGSRARFEDLGGLDTIRHSALMNVPPAQYPHGTITFKPSFTKAGWYIGVLTATDPQSGAVIHSVFPFKVGVSKRWPYLLAFAVIMTLSLLLYRLTGRKLKATPAA